MPRPRLRHERPDHPATPDHDEPDIATRATWDVAKVVLAVLLVLALGAIGTLAWATKSNADRAEGWRIRAIAAGEIVEGQRILIGQRSQALNRRTTQVNTLARKLRATRVALRRSEGDVSSLARRQRELADEKAQVEDARRQLETQQGALESVASGFIECNDGLFDLLDAVLDQDWGWVSIYATDRLSGCTTASARLDVYIRQFG